MRSLFLLRGAPSSGKSTWVKENNLEPYTLSTDVIRLMYQSPELNSDGTYGITKKNDGMVWDTLFNMLEKRMENGELVIVDATHYKAPLLNQYKDLIEKYRYRVYVVNFTNVSEEELLKRNRNHGFRKVPDEVIQKMVFCLMDDSEVKSSYKIISPSEAINIINNPLKPVEIMQNKVVVFGDIHGCMEPLKKYFDENPFNENTCYIFSGDYIDRGLQNKEVLEFLLSIYKNKNVILVEGNHEKWLRIYSDKNYDIEKYLGKEDTYKDFYILKVINELNNAIQEYKSQISDNLKTIDDISGILETEKKQNSNATRIYFEFEEINALDKIDELNNENNALQLKINALEGELKEVKKQNINTGNYIEYVRTKYKEITGKDLLLNINGIMKNEMKLEFEKEKNPIKSRDFILHTYNQIKNINKSELRQLCRKFSQMSYFKFNNKEYLVTHAGVPIMPNVKMATGDIIRGVGSYEDGRECDNNFVKSNAENNRQIISIHGHRNVFEDPCMMNGGLVYNLESQVEYGKYLSIVEITNDGEKIIQIKNDIYCEPPKSEEKKLTDIELLKNMYKSPLINIKYLKDDVISLNFTRDAFYDKKWNEQTCTARGLFVNKKNGNVVARSFSKFFNYNEIDATRSENLQKTFVYPVIGYKKENGFLGLITKYNDGIKFYTKSTDDGDFVNWFKKVFYEKTGLSSDKLYNILKDGYTYIFECIDHINDPHIIRYEENDLYLLEVMKNQMNEEHISYDELCIEAKKLNVRAKEKALEFNNWEEFDKWKNNFIKDDSNYEIRFEGYVLEDAKNFRVKFKSNFYTFWKQMRTVKGTLQKGAANRKIYKNKNEIEVVKLMESIDKARLTNMSIVDIQDLYYNRN